MAITQNYYNNDYETVVSAQVTDAARKCVIKQREKELKDMKKGWKFVKIAKDYQVFVPCDENGEPTEEGKKRIERQLNLLGVKH